MAKRPVSITLSDFEIECAKALARHSDRTMSYMIGRAVIAMLEKQDIKAYQTIREKHRATNETPSASPVSS